MAFSKFAQRILMWGSSVGVILSHQAYRNARMAGRCPRYTHTHSRVISGPMNVQSGAAEATADAAAGE
eukprot:6984215-Pyramimonas_sp.AAC.1